MARGSGPAIGRDEDLERIVDAVTGSTRVVLLSGPTGIGRSRMVRAVADALDGRMSTVSVTATSTPPPTPLADLVAEAAREGRTVALLVDDAHRLDPEDAAVIRRAVDAGEVRSVLSVGPGPWPEDLDALVRAERAVHHELGPLTRDDVGRLAASLLGTWPDLASTDRLHTVSGGVPLLVRELVDEAVEGGTVEVRHGLAHWSGVLGSDHLARIVEAPLETLTDRQRLIVDALALAEGLSLPVARALTTTDELAALETAGLVAVGPDDRVVVAPPTLGAVRRARIEPLRRAHIEEQLLDAISQVPDLGLEDRARAAEWALATGAPLHAEDAARAALVVHERGRFELAERLWRHVSAEDPSPRHTLRLAELLESDGRPGEAAALLDGLAVRLEDDEARALALAASMRVLTHGLKRPDAGRDAAEQAATVTDPSWRGYVEAQWATVAAMLGHLDEAGALGERLLADPDPRVRLMALPAVNIVAFVEGRYEDGLAAAQALVDPALAHRVELPHGLAVVFSALVLDLLALRRLDEADDLLRLAEAAGPTTPANRAYVMMAEGTLALHRGQVARARRALAESAAGFAERDPQGYRPTALALLAQACALGGDHRAALDAATASQELREARHRRVIDHEARRAAAWTAAADGDPGRSRRNLMALADEARDGGLVAFELDALHDAIRLGAGGRVQARVATVADGIQGERARRIAAHARALRSGVPGALDEVARAFEDNGELLLAAETAEAAAARYREQGVDAGARRSARRARLLAERCEGAVLTLRPEGPEPRLTPREVHVARLAADGRSSQAIADDLGLSRRTVDNQLSRVYAKLGVAGRRDLAEALRLLRPGDERDR